MAAVAASTAGWRQGWYAIYWLWLMARAALVPSPLLPIANLPGHSLLGCEISSAVATLMILVQRGVSKALPPAA